METSMNYHGKSGRLTELFLGDLAAERFSPEEYLPSEQKLAEHYQASRNTIRRIIGNLLDDGTLTRCDNHRVRINPEKYHELKAARAVPRQITLAFAYAAYPDAMISDVLAGLKRYTAEHDLRLQQLTSPTGHEPMLRALAHARSLGIDGVLVLPYFMEEYVNVINRLADSGVAVATLSELPGTHCSSICSDDYNGALAAVNLLITRYNRPVHLFGPRDESSSTLDRYNAYCRAMTEAGFDREIKTHTSEIEAYGKDPESWTFEDKQERTAELAEAFLKKLKPPASIFCINDYMAQGIYRAAKRLRLEIGRDLTVTGFDDLPMARRLTPPLTSVRSPQGEIGYQAAALLHRLAAGELNVPVHLRVPTELIERASC